MEVTTNEQNKGIYQLENLEIGQKPLSLNSLGKGKIDALKKSVEEINSMVRQREELSLEIFEEGEKLKSEINSFLSENEKNILGGSDAAKEKNELRKKKVEIAELQLNEKVTCFKDIAMLKKELRETQRDLSEKQERINELNDLMQEN